MQRQEHTDNPPLTVLTDEPIPTASAAQKIEEPDALATPTYHAEAPLPVLVGQQNKRDDKIRFVHILRDAGIMALAYVFFGVVVGVGAYTLNLNTINRVQFGLGVIALLGITNVAIYLTIASWGRQSTGLRTKRVFLEAVGFGLIGSVCLSFKRGDVAAILFIVNMIAAAIGWGLSLLVVRSPKSERQPGA